MFLLNPKPCIRAFLGCGITHVGAFLLYIRVEGCRPRNSVGSGLGGIQNENFKSEGPRKGLGFRPLGSGVGYTE